jgi:hypothetical protein
VLRKHGIGTWQNKQDLSVFVCDNADHRTALDESVRHRLGLTKMQQAQLIHMNDRNEKSFREIADELEAMPISRQETTT